MGTDRCTITSGRWYRTHAEPAWKKGDGVIKEWISLEYKAGKLTIERERLKRSLLDRVFNTSE
jgi:hypothetical protein